MNIHTRVLVPLFAEDIQLIAGVLQSVAEQIRALGPSSAGSGQPGAEATLGYLCVHWTQIAENDAGSAAANLNGERLYGVRLSVEQWELVSAQLSKYSTLLVMTVDQDTLDGAEDMSRAEHALKLMRAITEACGEH